MKRGLASLLKFSIAVVLLYAEQSNPITQELGAAGLAQAAASLPLRMGDFARTLSEKDIADIEAMVPANGGKPWLLEGPVGQIGFSITAYLPADSETRELRRGTSITLLKRPGESSWSVRRPGLYAQVALAGRDFNSITGDDDLNRPFSVSGEFESADLISLVTFIRSKPGNVEGSWPIEFIGRPSPPGAGMVNVTLNQPNGSLLMMARFRKRESGWSIESARSGRA